MLKTLLWIILGPPGTAVLGVLAFALIVASNIWPPKRG